jgi:hypothetical protein
MFYPGVSNWANTSSSLWGTVMLNVGESITLSVPYTLTVALGGAGTNEYAYSDAFWDISNVNVSGSLASQSAFLQANSTTPASLAGILSVNYTNNTGTAQSFDWIARVDAYSRTAVVAAVPEPETYGMMLAGLGLVGYMVRRRQGLTG